MALLMGRITTPIIPQRWPRFMQNIWRVKGFLLPAAKTGQLKYNVYKVTLLTSKLNAELNLGLLPTDQTHKVRPSQIWSNSHVVVTGPTAISYVR